MKQQFSGEIQVLPAEVAVCSWLELISCDIIVPMHMPPEQEDLNRVYDLLYLKRKVSKSQVGEHKLMVTDLLRIKAAALDRRAVIQGSGLQDQTKEMLLLFENYYEQSKYERQAMISQLTAGIDNPINYAYSKQQFSKLNQNFSQSVSHAISQIRSPFFFILQYFLDVASNAMLLCSVSYSQPLIQVYHGHCHTDLLAHLPFMMTLQTYEAMLRVRVRSMCSGSPITRFSGSVFTYEGYKLQLNARSTSLQYYHKLACITEFQFNPELLQDLRLARERQRDLGMVASLQPDMPGPRPTKSCRKSLIKTAMRKKQMK